MYSRNQERAKARPVTGPYIKRAQYARSSLFTFQGPDGSREQKTEVGEQNHCLKNEERRTEKVFEEQRSENRVAVQRRKFSADGKMDFEMEMEENRLVRYPQRHTRNCFLVSVL